jgi:hypothetical protein
MQRGVVLIAAGTMLLAGVVVAAVVLVLGWHTATAAVVPQQNHIQTIESCASLPSGAGARFLYGADANALPFIEEAGINLVLVASWDGPLRLSATTYRVIDLAGLFLADCIANGGEWRGVPPLVNATVYDSIPHRQVFGWYAFDEPAGNNVSAPYQIAAYRWLKSVDRRPVFVANPFWWWPNEFYTAESYDVLLLDIYSDRYGQLLDQYRVAVDYGFIGPTKSFMPVLPALPMPLLKPAYVQPCSADTAEVFAVACTTAAVFETLEAPFNARWLFGWGFYTWPTIEQCSFIYEDTLLTLTVLSKST